MYSTASSSSSSSSSNSLGLFDMPSPSSSLFSCDAPRHRETTSSSLDGCLFFGTMDDEPLPGAFDFLPESRDLHDDLEARIDEWCPSPELIPVDLPPLPRHHIDPRIPKEFGWFDYREEEQDTPDTPPSPPCRSPSLLPATTKVALVALPPSPPISPLALPQLSTFTRLLPSAAATTSSYDASSAIATAFFLDPSSPSSLSPLPSAHYSLRKHGQPLTFTSLSTLRGSLPPTSTSPDFIRAQRCVASCSFDPSAGSEAGGARRSVEVKPVRIKEHIIKCEERRKVFAEAEETDELRMLCEAQVDKLRYVCDRLEGLTRCSNFVFTLFPSQTRPHQVRDRRPFVRRRRHNELRVVDQTSPIFLLDGQTHQLCSTSEEGYNGSQEASTRESYQGTLRTYHRAPSTIPRD